MRASESNITPAWAPEKAEPAEPKFVPDPVMPSHQLGTPSMTEEMRRRIAEAGNPSRQRNRPLWIGLTAAVVLVAAGVLFPDTVLAFLPTVDAVP